MAEILIADSLQVKSDICDCEIQLCVGDITKLRKEDEVDVLVISAFPDDYIPTPTSLIGQLLLHLNVDIRELAKEKEEDLRSLYSCWWSKPLPDDLSFRKILCFEGGFKSGKKSPQVVGDIFRCLVPFLGNTEAKVMMPLLASGGQKFSRKLMLQQLVEAAIHWMEAGLPLRCLKIVLLQSDPANMGLILLFKSMKDSYRQGTIQKQKEHLNEYDVYLSYCEEDKKHTDFIIECLKSRKSDIRIFSTIQELDMEESWQEQLYDTITSCKRVLALLSPSYLKSDCCTEQYNIALCHSRKLHYSVLIPLLLADVFCMPNYMGITQYIDCRNSDRDKIAAGCATVVNRLTPLGTDVDPEVVERLSLLQHHYDVFLSYSHRNEDVARRFMSELRIYQPDINIFIDTAELKAGGAWQQTLYEALDRSQLMVALISNDYLRSKVCIEEISLGIALQDQGTCKVHPIIIEPLDRNVEWLNLLSPVKCLRETPEKESSCLSGVCHDILRDITESTHCENEQSGEKKMDLFLSVLEDARCFHNKVQFTSTVACGLFQGGLFSAAELSSRIFPNLVDIFVISSEEDAEYCQLLCDLIISHNQSLIIKKSYEENNSARLDHLENARLIIPLLSTNFVKSPELVHELNIAWCRQRYSSEFCFLEIILNRLPIKPTYIHLFPCFFNCMDKQWRKPSATLEQLDSSHKESLITSSKAPVETLRCLTRAIELFLGWLSGTECPVLGLHDRFTNSLHLRTCVERFKLSTFDERKAGEIVGSDVQDTS